MKTIPCLLALGAASLFGCDKETTQPASTAASSTELLSTASWKMVGYLYEATPKAGGPTTTINYFDRYTCEKDDLYRFGPDKKLVIDKNASLCIVNEAKTSVWSTWQLTNNDTELVLDRNGYNYLPAPRGSSSFTPSFAVTKLTAADLVLRSNVTRAADSVITITYSFVKN